MLSVSLQTKKGRLFTSPPFAQYRFKFFLGAGLCHWVDTLFPFPGSCFFLPPLRIFVSSSSFFPPVGFSLKSPPLPAQAVTISGPAQTTSSTHGSSHPPNPNKTRNSEIDHRCSTTGHQRVLPSHAKGPSDCLSPETPNAVIMITNLILPFLHTFDRQTQSNTYHACGEVIC